MIESARPRLNATISARPNATRCSEIAASRTTSADGHGSSPPETPTREQAAHARAASRVLVAVTVAVVVVVAVAVRA